MQICRDSKYMSGNNKKGVRYKPWGGNGVWLLMGMRGLFGAMQIFCTQNVDSCTTRKVTKPLLHSILRMDFMVYKFYLNKLFL